MRIQMPFSHGNENRNENREDETGRQQQQLFAYPGEHHDGYQPVYLAPPPPAPPADWPMPKLRLEAKELGRTGSKLFFEHINPSEVLQDAVLKVLSTLYTKEVCPRHVRSVTLHLDNMKGVAFTKGSELDDDHKEIHLNLNHCETNKQRVHDEIRGVLVHEMVHCYQYNGKGSCPGGLIEGIADYVRLKAGLAPPHWKKGGNKWDEGYQTTAYFLDWVESHHGRRDFVRNLNMCMCNQKYNVAVFQRLTGKTVDELWKEYKASL